MEFMIEFVYFFIDFIEIVFLWYIGFMLDWFIVVIKYVVVLRGWGNLKLGNCKIKYFR